MDASQNIMMMIIICSVFLLFVLLAKPIKYLLKISFHGFIGLLGIYIFNFVLVDTDISVGINFVTWIVTGILGIPGFILLYGMSFILT